MWCPHRLLAQVQFRRDLIRRPAVLEQTKDLGLARREIVDGPHRLAHGLVLELAEHADDRPRADELSAPRRACDCPSPSKTTTSASVVFAVPITFFCELVLRAALLLRCDDRRELLARTSPTSCVAAGFTQRMIPWSSRT